MDRQEQSGDISIIEELKRGEAAGLAAAYDRYGGTVYALILRITHDQSSAEDLVQELFLRLWHRAHDFDGSRGSLAVWLMTIARNMAIDHLRSSHARFAAQTQPLDYAHHVKAGQAVEHTDSALNSSQSIRDAFVNLNDNQKRVIEMAYFEGFSQSEIAFRLQEPLGTVKSWMRTGLQKLRSVMAEGRDK